MYETDYTILKKNGELAKEGDFGIFINKNVYSEDKNCYNANSWHYSYSGNGHIRNNLAERGNILVFGDSYEASMVPFLSLGIRNIYYDILRGSDKSAREYVEEGDYDTVIIAYAEFMIGAHDNKKSPNYRMFNLE